MEREIDALVGLFEEGRLTRRQLVGRLAAAATVATAGFGARAQRTVESPTFRALGLNHAALRVTDVARARDWYVKHLGLAVSRESSSNCFLTFGNNFLALFKGNEAGLDHYCYSIANYDPDEAMKTLTAAGIEGRREGNRVYFDDADGITVQIASSDHGP